MGFLVLAFACQALLGGYLVGTWERSLLNTSFLEGVETWHVLFLIFFILGLLLTDLEACAVLDFFLFWVCF
jgi:hypothetical protein